MKRKQYKNISELLCVLGKGNMPQGLSAESLRELLNKMLPELLTENSDVNWYDALGLLIAKAIEDHVGLESRQDTLLGLAMIFTSFYNPLYFGGSKKDIFVSINHTSIADKIYALIVEYHQYSKTPMRLRMTDIQDTLRIAGATTYRTALRHYETADEFLQNNLFLGAGTKIFWEGDELADQIGDELIIDESALPQKEANITSAFDVSIGDLLRKYSEKNYAYSPSSFSVTQRTENLVPRQLWVDGQWGMSNTSNFVADAIGRSGVVLSDPGAGISSTLVSIAHNNNKLRFPNAFVFCLSASDYAVNCQDCEGVWKYMADKISPSSQLALIDELQELNYAQKLIILVDDLARLDLKTRNFVLSQFAVAKSIYYAVTSRSMRSDVITAMYGYGYGHDLLYLQLMPLDEQSMELVARQYAQSLIADYQTGDIRQYFGLVGAGSKITPLEIGAYIASCKTDDNLRDLYIAWLLTAEVATRAGYRRPRLSDCLDTLEFPVRELVDIGRYLIDHTAKSPDGFAASQSTWIKTEDLLHVLDNVSLENIRRAGLIQTLGALSEAKLTFRAFETLCATLAYYYYGEPSFNWYEKMSINQDYLDYIFAKAKRIPDLINLVSAEVCHEN